MIRRSVILIEETLDGGFSVETIGNVRGLIPLEREIGPKDTWHITLRGAEAELWITPPDERVDAAFRAARR